MKNDNLAKEKEKFYKSILKSLIQTSIPFMVGGTHAVNLYTEINRETKDLDLFCKAGDYPRIVRLFSEKFKTELTDARWIAKIKENSSYVDIIFGNASDTCEVDNTWFRYTKSYELFGIKVKYLAPEELIWSKAYMQSREKYDGADVYHLILKRGRTLNWNRVLNHMEAHWEILLSHIINFRFIYPSAREIIPKWLLEELLSRVHEQFKMPKVKDRICRGHLLSRTQYSIDVADWGFKDVR